MLASVDVAYLLSFSVVSKKKRNKCRLEPLPPQKRRARKEQLLLPKNVAEFFLHVDYFSLYRRGMYGAKADACA